MTIIPGLSVEIDRRTNGWGWGPDGINPDRFIGTRRSLLAAIHFVLDGPDDEVWHPLHVVAKRFLPVVRDGRGFIPTTPAERTVLTEICEEYAAYEANMADDGDEDEEERAVRHSIQFAAECVAQMLRDDFANVPLED